MPDSPLTHLLISASAGAGKTYQLVRRYLHLLALGEDAESIAAMTFTRKAAGEFFGRILQRLAELAEAPEKIPAFFESLTPSVAHDADFGAVLRQISRRLNRLGLGTMDSFFGKIAACFPFELGLPAGARVMDEDETGAARREALEALLERIYLEDSDQHWQILAEAYKQATFGAEEKTADASLQDWAAYGLSLWEECGPRAADLWGNIDRIWPRTAAPRRPLKPMTDLLAGVAQHFQPNNKNGIAFLDDLLDQAGRFVPGLPLPPRVVYFLDKCREAWEDLQQGNADFNWGGKTTSVTGAAAAAIVDLAQGIVARECLARAERTRGLAGLLHMLAAEYDGRIRARGGLSFADIQRLLCLAASERSPWLQGNGDLWMRLDSRHQHWLLDEFQDTSRLQWRVIHCLVDEVIQDAEGRRSFFAVGDPKQSIYLWRQAEPGLFEDVLAAYPCDGRLGLHQQPLFESHRSAPAVLAAINTVFTPEQKLAALLPPEALNGFAFKNHVAVHRNLSGHAALLSPTDELSEQEPEATLHVTAALLRQIRPLARGLSCAVLVRQNRDARDAAEILRALTEMEVVCEAEEHPTTDNAATLALLSLLSLAAHPGDRFALEHLRMTPLWAELSTATRSWRYEVAAIQRQVSEDGFAPFVESWLPRIDRAAGGVDAFHGRRLAQLADIASEFDATGNRDIDAFLEYAKDYPLRLRGANQAIQVMTVHAAKGLEFDVVILPKLDQASMDEVRHQELMVAREADGTVKWVLQTPRKECVVLEPALGAERAESRRRGTFESLCRLYVAMSRAKRELYLIAEVPPKEGKSLKESRLLRHMLNADRGTGSPLDEIPAIVEWETGERGWWKGISELPPRIAAGRPDRPPLGPLLRERQPLPARRTPSGEETFHLPGRLLFSENREAGKRLGLLVHAMLSDVEYLPSAKDAEISGMEVIWRSRHGLTNDAETFRQALEQVRDVLRSPGCASVFDPPAGGAQLWRERSFDLMLDGEWVSGIFDRIRVSLDAGGKPVSAWIIDFKTDDAPDAATLAAKVAGYRPQLKLYQKAFARLSALPAAAIKMSLVFTRSGGLVGVD